MNTEEKLVSLGGKVWEKNDIKRVYISADVFEKFAKTEGIEVEFLSYHGVHGAVKAISTKDDSKKAWFNCKTERFESKKSMIQAYFNEYANK